MADNAGRRPGIGEEQFMILQMVQDGTISPDEGGRLMEAMARAARVTPPAPPAPPEKPRSVRVVVTNSRGEHEVDHNLPVGLVEMGLNIARRVAPGKVPDLPEIRSTIRSGYTGKLMDINNGNDRIEISIE